MRLITIEKASQEKQPDETRITTNINYIQNFVRFVLNNNMDKRHQIKLTLNKITCTLLEQIWDDFIIRLIEMKTIR